MIRRRVHFVRINLAAVGPKIVAVHHASGEFRLLASVFDPANAMHDEISGQIEELAGSHEPEQLERLVDLIDKYRGECGTD